MTEVRTITDAELEAWMAAVRRGFLSHLGEHEVERQRPYVDLARTWGAFDGEAVVGTLRSFVTDITVPGGAAVRSSCVTAVTVASTHRRRGLMSQLVHRDLADAKEQGDVLAALIAAEWPIYGRFGFGPATEHVTIELDARRAQLTRAAPGSVEFATPEELAAAAPAIHARHTAANAGELAWLPHWYGRSFGVVDPPLGEKEKEFCVLSRDAGGRPDGYAVYKADETWVDRSPDVRVTVRRLMAADLDAAARLWRYLAQIDWVTKVVADDRAPTDPLPWLLVDGRAARQTMRADFLWVRPLDLVATLGARRYLVPGRVVLEVVDRTGLAGGRVVLEGGPDGAACAPTTKTAGLTVPVEVLSSAYLGGVPLRDLARAGRLDVHDDAALATADTMFRAATPPWCSTWF